jgi:tetraacyldisaccharide 4'-kinase
MNIKKFILQILSLGKPDIPSQPDTFTILRYIGHYVLFAILYGFSLLYRSLVQLRMACYQKGIRKRYSLPCPVISIGNITTGGTGKTPMVILIAQILRRHGKRVVILSRGYRRSPGSPPGSAGVSPASDSPLEGGVGGCSFPLEGGVGGCFPDVRTVGDEPLLIARKLQQKNNATLPDVPVIVGSRRYLSGKLAIERFQPDVILLDDGFQHLQLDRTCDLVLIDATNPFGGGYILPAGFLREPVENLTRAHAFVITRSDEVADISPICQRLRQVNPEAPIFQGIHAYDEIRRADTGKPLSLEKLKNRRILGISGLANPISFHRLLDNLGLTVVKYLDFPDHHWYTKQDAHHIRRILAEDQIDAIMTTEKDEVKLSLHFELLEVPVYIMTIEMDVQPEKEFKELLLSLLP